jgi:hypothetical protein
MDIDKATEKVGKVDAFLTASKAVVKKHWGFLILILMGLGVWWFMGLVNEEIENPSADTLEAPYVVNTYKEDGEIIEVWSDGLETIAED